MTSVSNNNMSHVHYGTDLQKKVAKRFVQANDKQVTKMATLSTYDRKKEAKFANKISASIMSLPLVAGIAAGIQAKATGNVQLSNNQGVISSMAKKVGLSGRLFAGGKAALGVAGAMGIAAGVVALNNKIANHNPKLKKAEHKHPGVTMANLFLASTGVLALASAGLKKISPKASEKLVQLGEKIKIDKLAAKIDRTPEVARTFINKVASKISIPPSVKDKFATIGSKIKVPAKLKEGMNKLANLEATKSITSSLNKAGKAILKNPVTAAAGMIGLALVGHAVKRGIEIKHVKAEIKDAQQKTASNLIDAYAVENESLKAENAKLTDSLEKGNKIVAEDN